MNSSYELLKEEVNLEEIKEVYYDDKYKLDLETTLELMKETDMFDFSYNIVFYGVDFKVIKIDNEDEKYFLTISLKKPSKRKVFVPFTLNEYRMRYSEEHEERIPFKTEEMIKEDEEYERKQKESREAYKRKQYEDTKRKIETIKEELSKSETITEDFMFNVFEGGLFGNNAYLTVPSFPEKSNSCYISDKNFVNEELRKAVDYAGYASLYKGKLVVTAKKTLYLFDNGEETELEKEYKEVMKYLFENRKVIPVIGIGYDRIRPDDERRAKDILNEYLVDIKKYYEK